MRTHHRGRIRSRFVLAAVIGASTLGLGACAQPAPVGVVEVPPPAATSGTTSASAPVTDAAAAHSPPGTGTSLPRGWKRCVNTAENFSIGYPGTWHTTQIRPEEACAQFHPSRFTIPLDSEYPLTALNAKRVQAAPSRAGTEYERTLLWQQTTVAGRQAVRFETSSTGAGQGLAGTRQYGYVIRLGHGLISIHTTAEPGETRYAAWKTVVNKAVRTLTPAPPGCAPIRPGTGFYEAGRVATVPLTTPVSRCTTISVSDIVDPANPADRCQTFLVGFWPLVNGSLTYTEPVTACGGDRTVLARGVPDKAKFMVLYDVDYIDPDIQKVNFKVWR
ncbi:hypothetical protein DMB66_21040 [Actinoplanes sp. ATCC 53533]|uniref:hypothetical protein n=1 Tax=Actinoplanes sp. ATCC 53533 TaxID=1288362 RepID=UPI000F76F148|nr:hypothetical protein [Actinoplanes sp. ATCC 53533]RSM64123.1 hypothetical protein DMB66_21040 [Actinoplanes sp. ATCC 53533]